MVDFAAYMDEIGPGVVLIVGAALVLIPEPATSALGAGVVLFSLAWWVWEWGRGRP